MTLTFSRKDRTLLYSSGNGTNVISAFSEVRNELNGDRPDTSAGGDIAYGENKDGSDGPATMPRPFPLGTWNIYAVTPTTEHWLQPIKLVTDAHQLLDAWVLTSNGEGPVKTYKGLAGSQFDDWGYRIHYCNGSQHTDGCIGVVNLADMLDLAATVQGALDAGDVIVLEAVE